jgi:PhoPQ-activated pathogenicity-related protein
MNLTRYLESPYLDKLAEMVDPYCKTLYKLFDHQIIFIVIAYFDRYSKTKIFQLQGAGDEFFLVDSEVRP